MKLVWTHLARADRNSIRTFIARDNSSAAIQLDALFSDVANHLSTQLKMGRPGRVENTFELVAHPNYIFIYDITPEFIRVLRILHSSQQWPSST